MTAWSPDSATPDDRFEPGEVVGLFGGHVSRRTRGADRAMVVSTHPVVAGGRPHPEEASRHARVAFLGQVPVRVRGPVSAGDLLVPSGREDGTAVAISADELKVELAPEVIGRSLEDSAATETGTVKALVGLPDMAAAGLSAARRELRLYRGLLGIALFVAIVLSVVRWKLA